MMQSQSDLKMTHHINFKKIIESIPYMVAISEGDRIEYINSHGVKLLGLNSIDDIVGKSFMEFVHPSQWTELIQKIDQLMDANESIIKSDMSFLRRDKTLVDIEFSVIPISGEKNYFYVTAHDITEWKQEKMLIQQIALLAEIENGLFDIFELPIIIERIAQSAFSLINNNGGITVLLWNKEDQAFTVEKTLSNIQEQDEIDRLLCEKDSIGYQIIEIRQPWIILDVDTDSSELGQFLQSLHITAYAGVPLQVENECMGVLFAFGKQGNLYFEKNLDLLVSIANRSTYSIQRAKFFEQLREAKEVAEDNAKMNTLLLAESSHELRSPLARITYLTEILRNTRLNSEQREYLKGIGSAAEKLLYLIDDILDFTKNKINKLKLEPRSFDIRERIEECLSLNSAQAEEKGLSLAYWVDSSIPQFVVGDPNRIEQILNNLVTNSVKYTNSGFVLLTVQQKEPPQQYQLDPSRLTGYLLLSVKDTGIGIPVNRQQNLFKAFSRIDAPASGANIGYGLGLAICKQLVDTMGGEIWVESNGINGEGSEFKFTLPIQAAADVPVGEHLREEQITLKGKRVLVLSSNIANRQMITNWLAFWGMQVDFCEANIEPEKIETGNEYEIIILDLYGPQKISHQLLETLHKKHAFQTGSVIIYGLKPQVLKYGKLFPEANYLQPPLKVLSMYLLLRDIFTHPNQQTNVQPEKLAGQAKQNINILVAEDDPILLKALEMQLKNWGYANDTANNGNQVLSALHQKTYHVILLDFFMPGMDGLEATRQIRKLIPNGRKPYIILLTADSQLLNKEDLLAAGIDTILYKPVKGDTLKKILDQKNAELKDSNALTAASQQTPRINYVNVIDKEILHDFRQSLGLDGDQAISDLINSYLDNAPKLLEDMNNAFGSKDWDRLKWAAHALKGNSELFGASQLSEMCQKLVTNITHNVMDNLNQQIKLIHKEYKKVCEVLLQYSKNGI